MKASTNKTISQSSTATVSERFILLILTAIQFTNLLDFVMLMPPGGAITNFGAVGLISVLTTMVCVWLARNLKSVDSVDQEIFREAVVGAE